MNKPQDEKWYDRWLKPDKAYHLSQRISDAKLALGCFVVAFVIVYVVVSVVYTTVRIIF